MIAAFTELSATRCFPFRTDAYFFGHNEQFAWCVYFVQTQSLILAEYLAVMRIGPDSFRPWQIQGSLTACALSGGLLFMSDDLGNLE